MTGAAPGEPPPDALAQQRALQDELAALRAEVAALAERLAAHERQHQGAAWAWWRRWWPWR